MGIFARIFGICKTEVPKNADCWNYSEGKVEISLEKVPELIKPGNAVRLEGKGLPQRILLVCGHDGQFHAFENRCSHMGRRLDPLDNTKNIQCCSISCSTFDYTGRPVSGPGRTSLKKFRVEATERRIVIFSD